MTNIFTLLVSINLGLFSLTLAVFSSHNTRLAKEYPPDIVKVVDRKIPYWIALILNLSAVGVNFWFLVLSVSFTNVFSLPVFLSVLMQSLPSYASIPNNMAIGIAIGLTIVNMLSFIVVSLLRSNWGITRIDSVYVAEAISKKNGYKSLELLVGLANNRYGLRDLTGWNAAQEQLNILASSLIEKHGCVQGAETEKQVLEAIDQLEKFNGAIPSPDYVLTAIHTFGNIAKSAETNGCTRVAMRLVVQMIDISIANMNRAWHSGDRRRIQGAGFTTLFQVCEFALARSHSALTEVTLRGVTKKVYESKSLGSGVFQEIYLDILPFYTLIWDTSVAAENQEIAGRVAALISEMGRLGLEQDNTWLTAVSIRCLEQLIDSCVDLPESARAPYILLILRALVSISLHSKSDQIEMVNHAVASACKRVVAVAPMSINQDKILKELEYEEPKRALAEIVFNYMHNDQPTDNTD